MSRPLRLAAALLLLAAAPAALGFVRTTTAEGDPRKGACLLWPGSGLTYQINASAFASVPGCASPAAAAQLARDSFPAWTGATRAGGAAACTDFRFADGGDTLVKKLGNDGVNLVVFRKGLCSAVPDPLCAPTASEADTNACIQTYNCWSHGDGTVIALTTATFRVSTGEIVDADMELHGWNGDVGAPTGWYFTCGGPGLGKCQDPPYSNARCNWIDVGGTVTHEAGHMLGLDHVCLYPGLSCDQGAVMAPNAAPGETSKRRLAADDVAAVCSIYPAGQPASASAGCLGQAPAPKSGGCSTGGAGGLALLALAAARALRRPRAR